MARKASLALGGDDLSAARVTLSQLGGGFSGSYVVKAEIEGSSPFVVIKIDEDAGKLERELEGYRIIERRIEAEHYLPLLTLGPTWLEQT